MIAIFGFLARFVNGCFRRIYNTGKPDLFYGHYCAEEEMRGGSKNGEKDDKEKGGCEAQSQEGRRPINGRCSAEGG